MKLQKIILASMLGRIPQSVICLTADPGVASLIRGPARSHSLEEIDQEILLWPFFSLLLIQEWVVASYKQRYVHKVLVNCLVKLAQ